MNEKKTKKLLFGSLPPRALFAPQDGISMRELDSYESGASEPPQVGLALPPAALDRVHIVDAETVEAAGGVERLDQMVNGLNEADKNQRRGRGRPKKTEPNPWDVEGIPRATWYRRQAEQRNKSK